MTSRSPPLGQSGFTMVEVMIVVAIVAILAAVAYPFYSDQVDKARRADAVTALQQLAFEQAKWRANNTTYTATITDLQWDHFAGTTAKSPDGHYDVAILAGSATATAFTATATPTGVQAGDDCGTFALNQDGPITGDAAYAGSLCWRR